MLKVPLDLFGTNFVKRNAAEASGTGGKRQGIRACTCVGVRLSTRGLSKTGSCTGSICTEGYLMV